MSGVERKPYVAALSYLRERYPDVYHHPGDTSGGVAIARACSTVRTGEKELAGDALEGVSGPSRSSGG